MDSDNQNSHNGSASESNNFAQTSEPQAQSAQQSDLRKIDPTSIYPTPVYVRSNQPANSNAAAAGLVQNLQPDKRTFTFKKFLFLIVATAAIGFGIFYYTQSQKSKSVQIAIGGDYNPDFTVYQPSHLPDGNYYLQGVVTQNTKPIGTQSGIMLYYRSKNVSQNSDFTLDSSIVQIREDKVRSGYQPPESCANIDEIPTNKTACKEVGKTSEGHSIYRWPSSAQPLLQVGINGTFISLSIPNNGTVSTDELIKIAESLSPTSYSSLLSQVKP